MPASPLFDPQHLTDEQRADLALLSCRQFGRKYAVGYHRWRRLRTWLLSAVAPESEPVVAPGEAAEPAGALPPFEVLFEAVAGHAEAQRDHDSDQTFDIAQWGDQPVGLLWTADWHLGSQWCDYRRLHADMTEIGQRRRDLGPGALHLAHGGDGWDGYLTTNAAKAGLYETTETRIDRQECLFEGVAQLAGRWDYLLYGCHSSWTLAAAGRDPLTTLARSLGAMNGGFGMEVEVLVGEQQYRLVLRHKARGESQLNTTNAQRRMDDDFGCGPAGERADAILLAHLHNTDLQKRTKAGRRVVYLRAGSYKWAAIYDRSIGAVLHKDVPDRGNPLVILLPHEKRILPFAGDDWREGLDTLARLRG